MRKGYHGLTSTSPAERIQKTVELFNPENLDTALSLHNKIRDYFRPTNLPIKVCRLFYLDILLRGLNSKLESYFAVTDGWFDSLSHLFRQKGLDQPTFDLLVFLFKSNLIDVPAEDTGDLSVAEKRWNKIKEPLGNGDYKEFRSYIYEIFEEVSFDGNRDDFSRGDVYQSRWLEQQDSVDPALEKYPQNKREKLKIFKNLIHKWSEEYSVQAEPSYFRLHKLIPSFIRASVFSGYNAIRRRFNSNVQLESQEPEPQVEHFEIVNLNKIANLATHALQEFAVWYSNLPENKKIDSVGNSSQSVIEHFFFIEDKDEKKQNLLREYESQYPNAFFYCKLIGKAEEEFKSEHPQSTLQLFRREGDRIRPNFTTYWRNKNIAQELETAPERADRRISRRKEKKKIKIMARFDAMFATFFQVCMTINAAYLLLAAIPVLGWILIGLAGLGTLVANYILFVDTGEQVERQLMKNELGVLNLYLDRDGNKISKWRGYAMKSTMLIAGLFGMGLVFLGIGSALSTIGLVVTTLPFWANIAIGLLGVYVGWVLSKAFFSVFSAIVREGVIEKGLKKLWEKLSYKKQNAQHPTQSLSKVWHVICSVGQILKLICLSATAVFVALTFSQLMRVDAITTLEKAFAVGEAAIDWVKSLLVWLTVGGAFIYFHRKIGSFIDKIGETVTKGINKLKSNKKPVTLELSKPSSETNPVDEKSDESEHRELLPSEPAKKTLGERFCAQDSRVYKLLRFFVAFNTVGQGTLLARGGTEGFLPSEVPMEKLVGGNEFAIGVIFGAVVAGTAGASDQFNSECLSAKVKSECDQPLSSPSLGSQPPLSEKNDKGYQTPLRFFKPDDVKPEPEEGASNDDSYSHDHSFVPNNR